MVNPRAIMCSTCLGCVLRPPSRCASMLSITGARTPQLQKQLMMSVRILFRCAASLSRPRGLNPRKPMVRHHGDPGYSRFKCLCAIKSIPIGTGVPCNATNGYEAITTSEECVRAFQFFNQTYTDCTRKFNHQASRFVISYSLVTGSS